MSINLVGVWQRMKARESLEGSFQVIKLLSRRPTQWDQCIALARLKFDKYFKRKVRGTAPAQGVAILVFRLGWCCRDGHFGSGYIAKAMQHFQSL